MLVPTQYLPGCLRTPEEIHISKLLHLFHVGRLGNLLVVEKDPRWELLLWQLFADESNVMPISD
jgi:hypothetical protein